MESGVDSRSIKLDDAFLAVSPAEATINFDAALSCASGRARLHEDQIKQLEDRLSEDLSNCRAIESLLRDAFNTLKRNHRRAERDAIRTHLPHIDAELDKSMQVLSDLELRLPEIQSQVAHIQQVYDSGRRKAQELVQDLDWLNTDFYERWRIIIFTSKSPVSWRWKAIMRFIFAMCFALAAWFSWIALRGAYRAYRQKVMWGPRLPS
ncbi:uncharacterized protein STEHIDRAFT_147385 [Stereum hirsutum FP-91666 SS1]|uniref:uncharacterized protein n=1 Tax=Stereum hirsutum (strain FP-91666) TaxID=721885 RepID=UPI00044498FD|nr:uncharacterized protein STEHIDRAFT_147385 [Stereum hirsutum FP-91666 SS1]EIM86955.1 hypothetical protein STEHIDRAFT_147385 [Stereum hirsutum FP-91666 SS1]